MKRKILLVDESLTVQKVVSLTLDKNRYHLAFAKTRNDVMKAVLENSPDLILMSDQMAELPYASFPKELETWVGAVREVPPCILITAQDLKEQRHYVGVLKKPFTPQALTTLVAEATRNRAQAPKAPAEDAGQADELEDQRMQKIFNQTFADEATLVRETYKAELEAEEPTLTHTLQRPGEEPDAWEQKATANLWGGKPKGRVQVASTPAAASEVSENLWGTQNPGAMERAERADSHAALEHNLKGQNLEEMVEKALSRIVPAIVERLVQERLDKLLKEQDQFLDLKA